MRYHRSTEYIPNEFSDIVASDLTDSFSMKSLLVKDSVTVDLGERYGVVVVEDGEGALKADGAEISLNKSNSFFVTANSGKLTFNGNLKMIFCIA